MHFRNAQKRRIIRLWPEYFFATYERRWREVIEKGYRRARRWYSRADSDCACD